MNRQRTLLVVGYVIVSTVWGSTWLAIKIGLESVPPFLAAGVRFVIASALLYAIIRIRKLTIPFTPEAWKTYFAIGGLSFSIPFALVYWGEQFIPSSLGSILFGAFPLWVALFSHFLSENERMDRYKALGAVIGFVGVVAIFAPGLSWTGSTGMAGMGAVILATILQAYGLIPIKKHGKDISPFVMNFVGMVMGAVFLLSLSLLTERGSPVSWTTSAVLSTLYLAVFGSVVAFVSYYWLLKHIQAVYLSMSSFINPIVAVILGWIILGEALAPSVFVGAAFVLAGLFVANVKSFTERRKAA
jgi:drug/metabolite transporter (DMT)-like permease